jgi:hypothetical protein
VGLNDERYFPGPFVRKLTLIHFNLFRLMSLRVGERYGKKSVLEFGFKALLHFAVVFFFGYIIIGLESDKKII